MPLGENITQAATLVFWFVVIPAAPVMLAGLLAEGYMLYSRRRREERQDEEGL